MQIDFPLQFNGSGRTAAADDEDHIRDLIEQVLFTAPGERVNRPSFGSGLMQLVFAPNSDALAAATQMAVHGALQQWLGEMVLVEAVDVDTKRRHSCHGAIHGQADAGTPRRRTGAGAMTTATQYVCTNEVRRELVRNTRTPDGRPVLNGIEFVEVVPSDQKTLRVTFIHPLPGQSNAVPPSPAPAMTVSNVVIAGGVRITHIRVETVSTARNVLTVTVDRPGDFSVYTLSLVMSASDLTAPTGFDPQLASIEFSFKVACPSEFDCRDGGAVCSRVAGTAGD